MVDVWVKIFGVVKKGAGATRDVLLLVPRAILYPVKKPFASWDEMKHNAKVSSREAVGMDIPEKEKKYNPPIEATEASKDLGIEISHKSGKIKFLASRVLTGDIPHLTPEQLDKIRELNLNKENKYSNVAVFIEENRVVIEVSVKDIVNKIEAASENKEKNPEEIKKLVLKGIYGEVDCSLKGLAKITGGEFKVHTDRKLLHSIVENLYMKYAERLSKAVSKDTLNTIKPSRLISKIATEGNMTNPLLAYYQEIADGKTNGLKLSSKEEHDMLGKLGSNLSSPEDAYDKQKEPLFTPVVAGSVKRRKVGRS